jgi:uncharacterized protein YeaO (DUF488 family)
MPIRIVRLGTPRAQGEGVRLGTVRRPPRGVAKAEFARRDFYDVWFPLLAPSAELMKRGQAAVQEGSERAWAGFARGFRHEMSQPDASHALDALAALSHGASFSLGCYCEDERRCHRGVLRQLLQERGADLQD